MSETTRETRCEAKKSLMGMNLVCDRPVGHDGEHEDNSMRPALHFSWKRELEAPADAVR